MFEIKRRDKLIFNTLLSWRNIIAAENIEKTYMDFKRLIIEGKVEKNGPIISCIHGAKRQNNGDIFDYEVMIPVSGNITCSAGFYMLNEFVLRDILVCSFNGDGKDINLYNVEILKYMSENKLIQVTPIYNVLWEEEPDRVKVDLCFAVESRA